MDNDKNILSYLIKNENDATELLYALCAYRPFRDVVVKLFTKGQFGADDIDWEDLDTQISLGEAIPDLAMQGENVTIVAEVKTTSWRDLTSNQPGAYLRWLAEPERRGAVFFVALIPQRYAHPAKLQSRIESFHTDNTQQLLSFRFEEMRSMYDSHTAKGIHKLIKVIEEVATELQYRGYKFKRISNRQWCEDQYAFQIENLLWFGLWQEYWEASGVPFCFGVGEGGNECLFERLHPQSVSFRSVGDGTWRLVNIREDVL